MPRERFRPEFDPDHGDKPLTSAKQDIVIGRWQGPRDLLKGTGADWTLRGHRVRLLAQACASTSTVESWLTAEQHSADALVLRAAIETTRCFNLAIAAGRAAPIAPQRVDNAVMACLTAAEAHPEDPTPWVSLLSVARLYKSGVRRQEMERWWDELHARDPYNVEGHLQVLYYYSERWHGSTGLMYDFARDTAGVARAGCALPVLMQYARVEEFRHLRDGPDNPVTGLELRQHWNNDGAVSDVDRTWERWIMSRPQSAVGPAEVRHLNYLAHAACQAGATEIAAPLLHILGNSATHAPWSYTGDPERQLIKWWQKLRHHA